MTRVTTEQLTAARGCLLGLMLGDAIGGTGGNVPPDGPLPATSAGQLACFTVEGLIRAHVRGMHKGICHPPSVVWHADLPQPRPPQYAVSRRGHLSSQPARASEPTA
ncbi:hypothetical protein ACWDV4_20605 [Micromonospora sp. NPDC003197]